MTEEKRKFCPFTLGNVVPSWCCEEDCMAWIPEKIGEWRASEDSQVWTKYTEREARCRLIPED